MSVRRDSAKMRLKSPCTTTRCPCGAPSGSPGSTEWSKELSGRVPGGFDTVDVSEDPGFDDPTAQFLGSGNLRLGRYDFWVTGFSYGESEDVKVDFNLDSMTSGWA